MDAVFDGVQLPAWLMWAAPAVGLAFAAFFGVCLAVHKARAKLRFEVPLNIEAFARAMPVTATARLPSSTPDETRTDRPAMRTLANCPPPPPLRLIPVAPNGRKRGCSSIFRRRERRQALRRGGDPFPVLLRTNPTDEMPYPADVLDRSRTGLCIVVDREYPVTSVIQVRSSMYEEDAVWVPILIRHCRARGDKWVLGCQFTCEQPWSVLLLFG